MFTFEAKKALPLEKLFGMLVEDVCGEEERRKKRRGNV